jgi:hypothetical protein
VATPSSTMVLATSGVMAFCLALIHVYARKFDFLDRTPRSRWLSFSSGVSVSYVFIHLLPDLSKQQETISSTGILSILDRHVYLLALLGLTVFYELEQLVQDSQVAQAERSPNRDRRLHHDDTTGNRIFWLHIGSFAAYNVLVGYLLMHREAPGLLSLVLYAVAMGLHFVVNDHGLRRTHRGSYRRIGRWFLAAAPVVGWLIGVNAEVPNSLIAVLFSFLGGGVILNVLKEELSKDRKNQFGAFAGGALGYSILLLIV